MIEAGCAAGNGGSDLDALLIEKIVLALVSLDILAGHRVNVSNLVAFEIELIEELALPVGKDARLRRDIDASIEVETWRVTFEGNEINCSCALKGFFIIATRS